jgi:hypothetical protein
MRQLDIKTIYLCDDDEDDKYAFADVIKDLNRLLKWNMPGTDKN